MSDMLYDAQLELASEHSSTGSAVAPALATTEDGTLDKEHFEQWVFKASIVWGQVATCSIKSAHDWSSCPYLHDGETKARRRCPQKYAYTSIACPSMKEVRLRYGRGGGMEGFCPLGDTCPFAHNDFEYWLHHTRYHTCLCKKGERCDRKFCFFAHVPGELRTPAERPKLPPGATAAAAVLRRPKKERLAGGGAGPDSPAARHGPRQLQPSRVLGTAAVSAPPGSPGSRPPSGDRSASGYHEDGASASAHRLQGLSASLQTVTLGEEQAEGKAAAGGSQPGDALVSPFDEAERQQAFSALSRPCSAALPGQGEGMTCGLGAAHQHSMAPAAGFDNNGLNPTTPTASTVLEQAEARSQFLDMEGSQQSHGRGLMVDDVSRALMMEVARELSEGLIDAASATALLGRVLPAQALAQLSSELQVQAHSRSQLAPARGGDHGYSQQQQQQLDHHHHLHQQQHHEQQQQQQHLHQQQQQQLLEEMDSEALGAAAAALGSAGSPWLGVQQQGQQQQQQQLSRLQLGGASGGGPVGNNTWELGMAAEAGDGVVALGGWTSWQGYSVPAAVNLQPAWGSLVMHPSTPTGHATALLPPSSPLGFVARSAHGLPGVSTMLTGSGVMPAGVGSYQGLQY
ncbi:hypothetical protein N2152v2_000907 [Parachlorella kessleri]